MDFEDFMSSGREMAVISIDRLEEYIGYGAEKEILDKNIMEYVRRVVSLIARERIGNSDHIFIRIDEMIDLLGTLGTSKKFIDEQIAFETERIKGKNN